MIIKLDSKTIESCKQFADEQIETSKHLYSYRGEHRISKMKEDIITGKLGEIAVYVYLTEQGYNVTKPDFTVYKRQHKSFDADLMTTCGKNIHVKAQSSRSIKMYGQSWLFQKEDKVTKFPTKDDIIFLCSVHDDRVEVLAAVEALSLVENNIYKSPKVSKYASTKKALYFACLKDANINIYCLGIEPTKE